MKKLRRILPLMLALMLMATSAPLMAYASGTGTSDNTDSSSSDNGTADTGSTTDGTDSGSTSTQGTTDGDDGTTVESSDDGSTDSGVVNGETEDTSDSTDDTEKTDDTESKVQPRTASTDKVVTLGENLSDEQKATMYKYFGVEKGAVNEISVTHADEVKYMEGVASAKEIGTKTLSCAYIEPTTSGGIKVKTANLNFVTSTMIANALTTAGMVNCNVVAACPIEVSGTGALTGIMMAYETASGTTLDEGKKEAATEELMITGALADQVGEETATEVMAEAKSDILDKGLTDADEIGAAVDKIAENHNATLTDDQRSQIISLLQTMSKYDYDMSSIQSSLDSLNEKVGGLSSAWQSVKSFFVGNDTGILSDTDDSALGEDVVTTTNTDESGYKDGLFTRIKNLFSGK